LSRGYRADRAIQSRYASPPHFTATFVRLNTDPSCDVLLSQFSAAATSLLLKQVRDELIHAVDAAAICDALMPHFTAAIV
jgi:hypothetical protein